MYDTHTLGTHVQCTCSRRVYRGKELVRWSVEHCGPSIIVSIGRTQQADWTTRGDTRHPPGGHSRIRRCSGAGQVLFGLIYRKTVFVWTTAAIRYERTGSTPFKLVRNETNARVMYIEGIVLWTRSGSSDLTRTLSGFAT
ncbi:hypothetical protein Trydic_g17000 [Trypoxylus dichotomus]